MVQTVHYRRRQVEGLSRLRMPEHGLAMPARPRAAASAGPREGLGHALRTPLTALHGALGLLGAGLAGELPADAQALVSLALRNCSVLEHAVEAHLGALSCGERQEAGERLNHGAAIG